MTDFWDKNGSDPLGPISKPAYGKNFVHEPMSRLARGLNVGGGTVWAYLLQQTRMQGKKTVSLPNLALARLGVSRFSKARALQRLEAAKLIRIRQQSGRAPRVTVRI